MQSSIKMEYKEKQEKLEPRQRKKKLINDVKDLLEFYFSPANLGKDKFMKNLIYVDPFIDIEIFHRFNKIKHLTTETKILQKAVKKSQLLELSEDGSKVKRSGSLEMKQNEMECTIYIENLPPNSTHEWLKKVFSLYGTIDYISLPRFQQTGRPKGFAFIEFHTPPEAQKALEAFGGLASLDGTLNPAELLTIRTYGQTVEKIEGNPETASNPKMMSESDLKKRSSEEAFSNEASEPKEVPKKKAKLSEDDEPKKKKKKRRRNKKGKEYEPDSVYLRVMSKKAWKSLRNKYLNMQKENMHQLKFSAQYQSKYYSQPTWESERRNENCNIKKSANSNKPEFIPKAIVKISLNEALQDSKEFREGLTNGRTSIAYIDITSDKKEIYVRFKSSEVSKHFVEEGLWENVCLLEGKEESDYWEKVYSSWEQKRPKKKKKKNDCDPLTFRGRDKLVAKALNQKSKGLNTCIIFED